jgi:large subunit ribosomal protein L17
MGNKHLNRTSAHAQAMVQNTVMNLIRHERIKTTISKAKLVKRWADKMITLGKRGTLHARRQALAFLGSKPAVAKLFRTLGPRFSDRNGGYTRIVRLAETLRPAGSDRVADFQPPMGYRLGDGTALAYLEFVEGEITPREKRKSSAPEPFKPRRELFKEAAADSAAPADEAAEETVEESTEEAVEESTEEAAEETTEESTDEAADDGEAPAE